MAESEVPACVVVVAWAATVDVADGIDVVAVVGAGSEVHAAAIRATTIGRTNRVRTSVRLNNASGFGCLVRFASDPAALLLIHAGEEVDAEDEEDDQAEYSGP